jgi:hypothetical protein
MVHQFRRAIVREEAYGVVADVTACDEAGEEIPKFDRLVYADEIAARVRKCGREVSVVEGEDRRISVVATLGDAPDEDFDTMAGILLEAVS